MAELVKRVMIVDDNRDILLTASRILKRAGFETLSVESGAECIKIVRDGFKGIIFMDIMMPMMNGWQTIRALADEGLMGRIIISMFTAMDDPGPESDELKEHVMDYIKKPFLPEDLISTAEQCLTLINGIQE